MPSEPQSKVDTITGALRQRILNKAFGTEGRLPSLRMLAEQFGTTHETMNKVVQRLQAEGLLVSLGRAGVFVNSERTRIAGITPNFAQYLWENQQMVLEETDLDPPGIVSAPVEVAKKFGIAEGVSVVRRFHRQGTTKLHYRLVETYFPVELAGGEILEQMQHDPHFDVLAAIKERYGQTIRRVQEDVLGRLATLEEEGMLDIVRNAPVLEVKRTSYAADEDGPVLMYSLLTFVANHFVLSYEYVPYWLDQ